MSDLVKQKRYILDNFDFEKVYRVMHFLDWKYNGEPVKIGRLVRLAAELLDQISLIRTDSPIYSIETGGFRASKVVDDEGETISLDFIIESWDGYDED